MWWGIMYKDHGGGGSCTSCTEDGFGGPPDGENSQSQQLARGGREPAGRRGEESRENVGKRVDRTAAGGVGRNGMDYGPNGGQKTENGGNSIWSIFNLTLIALGHKKTVIGWHIMIMSLDNHSSESRVFRQDPGIDLIRKLIQF